MNLAASFAAAAAANPTDNLTTTRATATYYYRRRIGASLGYFSTTGSADSGLYPQPQAGSAGVVTSAHPLFQVQRRLQQLRWRRARRR